MADFDFHLFLKIHVCSNISIRNNQFTTFQYFFSKSACWVCQTICFKFPISRFL